MAQLILPFFMARLLGESGGLVRCAQSLSACIAAAFMGFALASPALAQTDTELGPHVWIELNTAQSTDASCTLTFQIINGHDAQIDKAVYETVLFNRQGQVDRLTLFDFGTLPPGRPRVRQFSVQGTACADLSRILINGAHACVAAGLDGDACETELELGTRTDIEVAG